MAQIIDDNFYNEIIELSELLQIVPSEKVSITDNTIKKVITLSAKKNEEIQSVKEKIMGLYSYENLKITFAQNTCINKNDFENTLRTSNISDCRIDIIYEQMNYLENDPSIFFLNINSFTNFSEKFFQSKKIFELADLLKKINISIYDKNSFSSDDIETSIFSYGKIENIIIPEALLNDSRYSKLPVSIIPYAIPSKDLITKKKAMTEMLELFSYRDKDDKLVFQHNKKKSLLIEDYDIINDNYDELSDLCKYIFFEEKHFWDKLLIAKKNIIDNLLDKTSTSELKKGFFNRVLDDTKTYYFLYIDETIENFISSIKEVIDTQMTFSEKIENRVREVTNQVSTEIISILGIIISGFILEDINYKNIITPIIGLVYVSCIMFFKEKSGQFGKSEEYRNQLKNINDQFPSIIMENEKVSAYKNEILEPQILRLGTLENIIKIFYWCLIVAFIIYLCMQLFISPNTPPVTLLALIC